MPENIPYKFPFSFVPFLAAVLLLLWSCQGGGDQQLTLPESDPVELLGLDTTNRQPSDAFQKALALREKGGDTLSPVAYTHFSNIFPDTLEGYTQQVDEGQTFKAEEFSFSEADRVFYKGEEGETYVEFHAADYAGDTVFFQTVLEAFNAADGVEVEGEISQRFKTPEDDYLLWTTWQPETGIARLQAGIAWRYYFTIEANEQQGPEWMKKLWEDLGAKAAKLGYQRE